MDCGTAFSCKSFYFLQVKEGPAGSVNEIISQDLKNNDVFLYMKVGHALVRAAVLIPAHFSGRQL